MREKEPKFSRESLLASRRYETCQRDFLAAVLTEPEYTLRQADRVVREFFRIPKGEK